MRGGWFLAGEQSSVPCTAVLALGYRDDGVLPDGADTEIGVTLHDRLAEVAHGLRR